MGRGGSVAPQAMATKKIERIVRKQMKRAVIVRLPFRRRFVLRLLQVGCRAVRIGEPTGDCSRLAS
jgi:hypothetical protein